MAYLPVELPTGDYYGGHRPGNGLYGESVVAVDLKTGAPTQMALLPVGTPRYLGHGYSVCSSCWSISRSMAKQLKRSRNRRNKRFFMYLIARQRSAHLADSSKAVETIDGAGREDQRHTAISRRAGLHHDRQGSSRLTI